MTANVAVLQAGATIADALQIMSTYKTRHVPVVDGDGRPEGVISFRSVIRYVQTNFGANG
jgi:CBS domain-containing protein